jgi:hypothetical protein
MLKLPLAVTVVTSVLVTLTTGAVAQKVPPELPLAIICWNERANTWRVGYLSTVKEDGTATYATFTGQLIYATLTGQLTSTINAKGVAAPPSSHPANLDCFGKTLDELRALGRVLEFQRPR